jgi:hypothetical protein
LLLWLGHLLDAERATRGTMRIIVHYEELVGGRGWRAVADRIAAELNIEWPCSDEAAVDEFLAPELRRRRDSDAAAQLPSWIGAVYDALRAGELHLDAVCDAVRQEFAVASELLYPRSARPCRRWRIPKASGRRRSVVSPSSHSA